MSFCEPCKEGLRKKMLKVREIRLRGGFGKSANEVFEQEALYRCHSCCPDSHGKENYALSVAEGICAWCGATRIESDVDRAFKVIFMGYDPTTKDGERKRGDSKVRGNEAGR